MKIVFLDAYTSNHGDLSWSDLEALGDLTLYDRTEKGSIVERARKAEILITNKILFDRELFSKLPDLKYLCISATGYNNVDLEAARDYKVTVSNVVGYSTSAVAQHVFSLILSLSNKSLDYSNEVHQGQWSSHQDFSYYNDPIIDLQGKVMGIYGFGKIGKATARIAKAFGMKVIAVHKHPERDKVEGVEFVDLNSLLTLSDIISLHAPLTKENTGLFNLDLFKKMKKSTFFINTSRGQVLNEKDLAEALTTGLVAGAGLDVLCDEPPLADNPLLGIQNCVITPHHAWASANARVLLLNGLVENIKSYQKGRAINVVS